MKLQLLFTIALVLMATLVSAKPIELKRGLAGKLVNTIKKLLFHGVGTFFDPPTEGGSQGACGQYADSDSQIVALNAAQYGDMNKKSKWCGKKVKICYTGKNKCTIATITDACPGCAHGCLDLTPNVWGQLESDYSKGVIDINWDEYTGDDDADEDDEST